jgi:hypothetical protein
LKAGTAPGPDELRKPHLHTKEAKEILHYLFNILLASSLTPTEWKMNRTTLIPKPGKDLNKAENFRLIIIGSILSRIFWGIIDQRLREQTTFSPRQKGFVHESGCFNNIHIFNELLYKAKRSSGLVAIQLDISKAFDTIPAS